MREPWPIRECGRCCNAETRPGCDPCYLTSGPLGQSSRATTPITHVYTPSQ